MQFSNSRPRAHHGETTFSLTALPHDADGSQKEASVRKFKAPVLVQANHHVAKRFIKNNEVLNEIVEGDEGSIFDDSFDRAATFEVELKSLGSARSLDGVAAALDEAPVCNEGSYQQMAFCPKTGELRAWRLPTG